MKFQIKTYEGFSAKIRDPEQSLTIVLLSDLHQKLYDPDNHTLIEAVASCGPDLILIAGDMVISKCGHFTEIAENTVMALTGIAPVYYANGNHEKRIKEKSDIYGDSYDRYVNKLKQAGVHYLENATEYVCINGIKCRIYGLDLSLSYYARLKRIRLEKEEITARIGESESGTYNILIAHHPRYGDAYFDWGADLTVSGHIHGGVMRLGNRACVSPDGRIFPSYGYGWFQKKGKYMAVSAGLGEHTIPLRIMNPRELVRIVIKQEVPHGDTREIAGV